MTNDLPELPEYLFHKARANILEDWSVGKLFNHAECPENMRVLARDLVKKGWIFQVVNQRRGRCYYATKTITIPLWATKKDKSELRWYIAHEMAHIYAGWKAHHGPRFMEELMRICPIGDQHWEYTYKPRNAASAGLSEVGSL